MAPSWGCSLALQPAPWRCRCWNSLGHRVLTGTHLHSTMWSKISALFDWWSEACATVRVCETACCSFLQFSSVLTFVLTSFTFKKMMWQGIPSPKQCWARRTPRRWMTPCATGGFQHGTKTPIVQTIGCLGSPHATRELPKTVLERAPLQDICTQKPQGKQCLPMAHCAGGFLRGPKIMAADLDGPTPNVNRYRNPHADTASKPV